MNRFPFLASWRSSWKLPGDLFQETSPRSPWPWKRGKEAVNEKKNTCSKNLAINNLKSSNWLTIKFAERRIIYDFDKFGDSPACIGKEKNLENQVALTQGFGITENTTDLADFESKLLETNVTLISNDDCYNKIRKIQLASLKGSAIRAMPEGVTDQMLCTLGIVKQIGNRKIVSVC